jgi:hypothetical protein
MKMKSIRKITAVLFLCIGILLNAAVVFAAEDTQLVYSGGSDTAEFEFEPGISFDYSNLMPGDVSSQELTLKNESTDNIFVRLSTRELVNDDFLSNLDLKIEETKDGTTLTIFEGKVSELLDEEKVNYNGVASKTVKSVLYYNQ